MKKFAFLSDIHGHLPLEDDRKELEKQDVICFCGDVFEGRHMSMYGNKKIGQWTKSLADAGKKVIMTPGNHDLMLYRGWLEKNNLPMDYYCRDIMITDPLFQEEVKEKYGIDVLIDEGIEVDGVKIWGSPWSNKFYNWAFMLDENGLYEKFSKIPEGTSVLLVHTPPKVDEKSWEIDVSDYDRSVHCGSASLAKAIGERLEKADVYCGHIHSGNHDESAFYISHDNRIINVSYVNEDYSPYYEPSYCWIGR